MSHIAEGLKVNRKLKSLELDYNSVGDVSIFLVPSGFHAALTAWFVGVIVDRVRYAPACLFVFLGGRSCFGRGSESKRCSCGGSVR